MLTIFRGLFVSQVRRNVTPCTKIKKKKIQITKIQLCRTNQQDAHKFGKSWNIIPVTKRLECIFFTKVKLTYCQCHHPVRQQSSSLGQQAENKARCNYISV